MHHTWQSFHFHMWHSNRFANLVSNVVKERVDVAFGECWIHNLFFDRNAGIREFSSVANFHLHTHKKKNPIWETFKLLISFHYSCVTSCSVYLEKEMKCCLEKSSFRVLIFLPGINSFVTIMRWLVAFQGTQFDVRCSWSSLITQQPLKHDSIHRMIFKISSMKNYLIYFSVKAVRTNRRSR